MRRRGRLRPFLDDTRIETPASEALGCGRGGNAEQRQRRAGVYSEGFAFVLCARSLDCDILEHLFVLFPFTN